MSQNIRESSINTKFKFAHRKVINASGRMSILGTSTVSDEVAMGMKYGAQNFFIMSEFIPELEKIIANEAKFEYSKITASASAGIALSTAATISRGNRYLILNPYAEEHTRREIIIAKGQNIDYGAPMETMIMVGGGKVVEAGYANKCDKEDIKDKITKNTAAIMFVISHHSVQKNMLSVNEAIEVSREYNIPIIVDAAAEEDIFRYSKLDIDLLIFSGSKAFEGPTSGIVFGKENPILWMNQLNIGIARAMKVSKENALGLFVAIRNYLNLIEDKTSLDLLAYCSEINSIESLDSYISKDLAGRDIYRIAIKTSKEGAMKIIEYFENGDPAIFTRNYLVNEGIIELDTRVLTDENMKTIIYKLKELFQ